MSEKELMRVIAGKYRHRLLDWPVDENIRPTKDRVREAILSSLGDITGKAFLDLYSGSGAMGIEAISRGLETCVFNDINPKAYQTTINNIKACKIEDFKVYNLDYKKCLEELKNKRFDCIFLDPPYKLDVIDDIIEYIDKLIDEKLIKTGE